MIDPDYNPDEEDELSDVEESLCPCQKSLGKLEGKIRAVKHFMEKQLAGDYGEEFRFFRKAIYKQMHLVKANYVECPHSAVNYLEYLIEDLDNVRKAGRMLQARDGFFDEIEKMYVGIYDFIQDDFKDSDK